ncbi:LysR family transcriptional regulator [Nonomuraea sp. K274]|uniref:LysR family transcriptional regulator n=1 Tax=Nonomuraea cypriaca TaxID=1187855 RepID=A0A931F1T8_9ACTN|nr:LysR substrate-binding domain-containing protein [Nonomuraea cypriaca]MBF8189952.1 LysR family transcriptional regulator [Nonomuraea cypriaca]
MTSEVDLRLIRSFLAVAEESHVGRAAERLHVSQPTLSRQVQALEAQVGAVLLIRGPHGVSLTEAGRELMVEGERLLAQSGRALDRARRAARGDLGHLSVGFVGSALDAVVSLLGEMRLRHVGVAFTLTERPFREQTAGLATGEDDVAFVRDENAADSAWRLVELLREDMCLVVPATHPMAERVRVTRKELLAMAGEPFLSTRRWMSLKGFEPRSMDEVASTVATLRLVEAEVGVSLMPARYRSQAGPGVRFVPVAGHTSSLQLALPHRPQSAVTRLFIGLVAERFPP